MKYLIIILALVASPALAADVTVTFSPEETQTIINELDAATKAGVGGLAVASQAISVVHKLQEAAAKPIADPVPMPPSKPEELKK